MSTDWNQKLAWVLRDPSDASLDLLQLSSHRAALSASADAAALPEVGPRGQWLTSGADRVPFPATGPSAKVDLDWAAAPEVTHPLAPVRTRLEGVD
ncbi:MAG: hypothetical protein MUF54_05245, partial [Polyangiaceae bacterium]|nr:hypothetical protein [Polyangiaceae bacterium]